MRAAILLAAGSSRRFGRGDKLMAGLHGRAVLLHALARAIEAGSGRVLVVVPSLGGRVGRAIGEGRRIHRVVARSHREGLSASLGAGLEALRPIDREVAIFLADMPFASASTMRIPGGYEAVRPLVGGVPGHPMLVRSRAARAARLSGDEGLARAVKRVAFVAGHRGNLIDLDTRASLRRARLRRPKLN